ncbi:hypothetical protein GCM10011322_01270 [Salinarimonas ramus]|uniref:Ribbon-helix-helix protein CopG domain-containing protein n=1 Tax=Salinarimonas ramus TaxID=690164 RepID=A0A917Q3Z0_9HYPH|nr:hypothetical protein GCM10011322_01270 [Salinarimonas ramus]
MPADPIQPTRKSRGRPAIGKGAPVQVRLRPEMEQAVDAAIAASEEPKPTRPELIRRALAEWLRAQGFLTGEGGR